MLLLHCKGLPPPTSCRLIPALRDTLLNFASCRRIALDLGYGWASTRRAAGMAASCDAAGCVTPSRTDWPPLGRRRLPPDTRGATWPPPAQAQARPEGALEEKLSMVSPELRRNYAELRQCLARPSREMGPGGAVILNCGVSGGGARDPGAGTITELAKCAEGRRGGRRTVNTQGWTRMEVGR